MALQGRRREQDVAWGSEVGVAQVESLRRAKGLADAKVHPYWHACLGPDTPADRENRWILKAYFPNRLPLSVKIVEFSEMLNFMQFVFLIIPSIVT